jgi:hypothetical protein
MFSIFFSENCVFYEIMWENMVKPERPQITMWYGAKTRFICRITKARIQKHTHSNSDWLYYELQYEYFVARKQCKGNSCLPFCVNTGNSYVVASYFYVKNNKNVRYSIAIMVTRTRHNTTLDVSRLSCIFRLSFPISCTDFRDAKQMESKCRNSNVSFVICNKKHNRITHSNATL